MFQCECYYICMTTCGKKKKKKELIKRSVSQILGYGNHTKLDNNSGHFITLQIFHLYFRKLQYYILFPSVFLRMLLPLIYKQREGCC